MHKLLISLLLLVGFSSLPFAQQIEVKDTEGKPLPFCHLRVENQKTSSFFFDRTLSSYYTNYKRKVWQNQGLSEYMEQYGKHLDFRQAVEYEAIRLLGTIQPVPQ